MTVTRISVCLSPHSADIGCSHWIVRFLKDLLSRTCFDKPTRFVVNPEQGGIVRNATRLSQVMRDDHNRVAPT